MRNTRYSQREVVPSGSYSIYKRTDKILEAFLGTCVGLTICDKKENVGGLLHILLPEPVGDAVYGKPENYALTGIPIFLKSLYEQGAKPESMKACLAGGALVGPVSQRDFNLDIGGRTAEIAERILKEDNIPLAQSETGGFFSCKISLNMKNWETYIEPINDPMNSNDNNFMKPTEQEFEAILKSIRPIPQIALKIMRMIREEIGSLEDIANEVRKDQVICARVIQLCNSALFNLKTDVESIDRAMVIMGEKSLLQMVTSAAFDVFFSQTGKGYSLCKGGLFRHAVGTAMICEKLAESTKNIPRDLAYTAGLLHDIGKVVLDQFVEDAYPLFYRRIQEDGESLIEVEKDVFGITHTEAGARLAKNLTLPEALNEVIRNHHYPENASHSSELVHLTYLADLLMSRFLVGQEMERINTDALDKRMKRIGFSIDNLPELVNKIPEQLFILSASDNPIL